MMDPTGIKSFLATLYITDFDASVTDPSANPYAVSVASAWDGRLTADRPRRHRPPFGGEVRDGFVRSPIAVAGGRIDVLGPYSHRRGIGGHDRASSICVGANLCLFRGTVSDGATDGLHDFTIRRTGKGNLLSSIRTCIWQTDRVLGEGDALCELPIGDDESAFGITYDPLRQCLWVQVGLEFAVPGGACRVLELGLDGTVRSAGPSTGLVSLQVGVLAMDQQDQPPRWIQFGKRRVRPNIAHVGLRFDRIGQRLSYYFLQPCAALDACCRPLRPIHGAELELPVQVTEPASLSLFAAAA